MAIDHSFTANRDAFRDPALRRDMEEGIADPSDSIIPAGTSLYRAGHEFRTHPVTGVVTKNPPEAAYASPWWTTYYDFNKVTWASSSPSLSEAARDASAIHRGWGGDCALFASIVTTIDLSVWYGLGKSIIWKDLGSPQMSMIFASDDILQIYIPGFKDNAEKWSTQRHVYNVGQSLGNGAGFQGNLPLPLRTQPGASATQMSLFDRGG